MISIPIDDVHLGSTNSNQFTIWQREIPMSLLLDQTDTLRQRLETWYTTQKDIRLANDEPINWPNYILGILVELINRMNKISLPVGFNVVIISDVPCNKGVASSAALEIAVARAGSSKNIDQNLE